MADAGAQRVERVLALGDIGSGSPLNILNDAGAEFVFGNWEASGLRGMPQPFRGQVAQWPAQRRADDFVAAHASPVWPDDLPVSGVVDYLRSHALHWLALFPSMYHSADARWAAFLELEACAASVFFHGHTHIQQAWTWKPGESMTELEGPSFLIPTDGCRVLVGVGSAGDARDGPGACYALYDDEERRVTWRRV